MARQLNNTTRRELALDLGVLAVKKNAAALSRLATHLVKLQRDVYERHLLQLEADIPVSKWESLIQKGLLPGFSGRDELFEQSVWQEEDGSVTRKLVSVKIAAVEFGRGRDGERRTELWREYIDKLRSSPVSTALDLLNPYSIRRQGTAYLTMTRLAQPDLPSVPGSHTLDPLIRDEQKLLRDSRAFLARLAKVLSAGFAYLEECLDLLAACKTEKQLLDLFPEAAKLLPPAPVVTRAVVPVEQAQKLRKMLETGVPED